MTVPRPYEANLGPKNAIFDFSNSQKYFWSKICLGLAVAKAKAMAKVVAVAMDIAMAHTFA